MADAIIYHSMDSWIAARLPSKEHAMSEHTAQPGAADSDQLQPDLKAAPTISSSETELDSGLKRAPAAASSEVTLDPDLKAAPTGPTGGSDTQPDLKAAPT